MVDQLNAFAGEVTRVAREVGTDGRLGGQANVLGVAGTWKDLTESVNSMASNLTTQVRNIADVSTAIANGDLSKKITVDVSGEILELKDTINTMVDQLNAFAGEVTRVAREVGTEGKLGGQAAGEGRRRHLEGFDRLGQLDGLNLTGPGAQHRRGRDRGRARRSVEEDHGQCQRRDPAAEGDHQHDGRSAQRLRRRGDARRARGRHRRPARRPGAVPGVAGTWKDLTDSVNSMAGNLTGQVRNIAEVATAIANGDLSRKITVDVRGEILQLKETLNTMVDQLNRFAGEVTRVAREVGTEGRLGGQAQVPGVAGTWKDLTDSVNSMAGNLTAQVRNIAEVTTAVARGDLGAQDHRRREGRNPRAEEHDQHDGRPAQRLRLRGDARRARGRHRRQARRPGGGAGRRRHLEGPDRQRQLHGQQPDRPGPQHRRGRDRDRQRRSVEEDHGRRARRDPAAEGDAEHDGRSAALVRGGGDARRARGRHRRPARRPGGRAGRRRHLEGSDRQRQPAGRAI